MVELRVLGSPSLVGPDGHEARSVLQQPKRLGLLTYLALTSYGSFQRRDRILGVFWPDSPEDKARASLATALVRLRDALGADVILKRGRGEIGIDPSALSCDAGEFLEAVEAEEWHRAVEAYHGPLLDGFFLDACPEFDVWLEHTRAHLQRTVVSALGRLTEEAIAAGDDAARALAERAYEINPLDGGAVRWLIEVLARAGQRDAALGVYETYAAKLRDDRGIEASPETIILVQDIREGRLGRESSSQEIVEASDVSPRGDDPLPSSPPSEVVDRLNAGLEGRYKIERELGEGGMATVYLADDLRHERKVALKVLKPELAAVVGAERFLAEIKTTANLQHPHILPLFDSGEADGFLFYVMPYVEGESLRERLDREHQLPVEEAVRIATDVAEALDYAHRQGFIHRDIKPGNILLQDGRAMVADFGIGRAVEPGPGVDLTATGALIGTPAYASPEQLSGSGPLDGRSDIYSLGCVLYEMLAGEPPHSAPSPQAMLARIVSEPVRPVSEFREFVPRHVVDAIRKSLAKRAIDRFPTATGLIAAIDDPSWSLPDTDTRPVRPRRWTSLTTAFAGLSVVLAGALLFYVWRAASRSEPTSRTPIAVPTTEAIRSIAPSGAGGPRIALTPDGSTLIYEGPLMDGARIWMRRLGELRGRSIPGTENGFSPFPSPDGSRLAFVRAPASDPDLQQSSITLHTMTLDGREEATLLTGQLGLTMGGSWGTDGFLYVQGASRTIIRVRERDGVTTPVTTLDSAANERRHRLPDVLPDAGGMLMTVSFAGGADSIAVVNLTTLQREVLIEGIRAVYTPPGYIVISGADGILRAARFDPRRRRLTSALVEIARDVQSGSIQGVRWSEFAASRGTLAYLVAAQERSLVWVPPDGSAEEDLDPDWRAQFRNLALSPDAKRLAVSIAQESGSQIWVKDIPGGAPRQLTFEGANDRPSWHPDGELILFQRNDGSGNNDLFEQRADGSEAARLVLALEDGRPIWEGQWFPAGQWLIYRTGPPTRDIFATRPGLDTTITISAGSAQELFPAISPNGRFVAYMSNESGRNDIWVRPFPDPARALWLASTNGGGRPLWSHDGRHLYYWTDDLQLVAVPVRDSGTVFEKESERILFSYPLLGINTRPYQQGPDGRFLVVRREETAQLVIVRNFEREIERGDSR